MQNSYTVVSICLVFLFAGILMLINGDKLIGAGIIFLGLLLFVQYMKKSKIISKEIIKVLTWIVVLGFLVIDVLLLKGLR